MIDPNKIKKEKVASAFDLETPQRKYFIPRFCGLGTLGLLFLIGYYINLIKKEITLFKFFIF